jgi:hypothetical protein
MAAPDDWRRDGPGYRAGGEQIVIRQRGSAAASLYERAA